MSDNYRALIGREKQRTRKLIVSCCANYDSQYGCLLLDSDCPMFGISYTGSAMCRYLCNVLLPADPELESVFHPLPLAVCRQCGKGFAKKGKQIYYSDCCAEEARRRQTAARVRKHRQKKSKV